MGNIPSNCPEKPKKKIENSQATKEQSTTAPTSTVSTITNQTDAVSVEQHGDIGDR